jgi:phage shock protein PspC (stress-responsive transcriptional regulator)
MRDKLQSIITFFERYSFGVCTYLGEKFNVSITKIRLFFIYSSFLAVGFPLIVYIFAGIVLDIRNYVKRVHTRVMDL